MSQDLSTDLNETKNNQKQDQFIEMQNHCPLCNGTLEIKISSYLENYSVKEEAYCNTCNIKTRSKDHKFH